MVANRREEDQLMDDAESEYPSLFAGNKYFHEPELEMSEDESPELIPPQYYQLQYQQHEKQQEQQEAEQQEEKQDQEEKEKDEESDFEDWELSQELVWI